MTAAGGGDIGREQTQELVASDLFRGFAEHTVEESLRKSVVPSQFDALAVGAQNQTALFASEFTVGAFRALVKQRASL